MGSSCFSRGNNRNIEVIQDYLAQRQRQATVELVGHLCKGQCKSGPNITINGRIHHESDASVLRGVLDQHFAQIRTWTA
jgi:NADH:ubiquinone oxidoreductase subunit E